MELNALFPNLNVMWTRWSEYTLVKNEISGPHIDYLVPAPGATALTFNCVETPETLVADALELGRQLFLGTPEKDHLCTTFAARHGLLGLKAEKGIPFDDRPEMHPFCQPLNSQEYGEEIGIFQTNFMELYQHFLSTRGELDSTPIPAVMDISGLMGYHLTSGQPPQLVWEVWSMQSVLRLAYAAMVTSEKSGLRVCKNCGKVYYNSHAKSEYCGSRCRNYFNVKVFREKERNHMTVQ